MQKSDRIALFLGAGASAPFGFPVTNAILSRIRAGLDRYVNTQRAPVWCKSAHKRNPRFGTELRRFVHLIFPGMIRSRSWGGGSIIDVLSQVDYLIQKGGALSPTFREEQLRAARHMLNVALNGVLDGRKQRSLKSGLVDWILKSARARERTTIVSTNYDVAYELPLFNALEERGRNVGRDVDFGVSFCLPNSELYHRPENAPLAVFKLHGSLNWLRCEVCRQLYVNTAQRIASLEFWVGQTHFNTCDCGGRLRSLMIAPSLVRDTHDATLSTIWSAALEDLRQAREWIFIGYSLPMEDVAIRTVLLQAFHNRSEKDLRVRLALLDPHETARRSKRDAPGQQADKPENPRKPTAKKLTEAEKEELRWAAESSRTAAEVRSRYAAFFQRGVFDNREDYYPGGVEEIVRVLAAEARG